MPQPLKASPIQKHLEIKDIHDGVVMLKDGGMRVIIMTTSFNFALKSSEEQNAVIYRYQDFLNSLDFPIQIVISSRKFDISSYIAILEEKQTKQENELLRIQTSEYIDFIKGLTEMTNIMTESFYLVVPYSPPITKKFGFLDKILGKKEPAEAKEREFKELKADLWQRVEFVITGLRGIGIRAVPLETEELVELFYKLYNPGAKEEPEIEKANQMRIQ